MSELPVRIYFRANSEANSYSLINQADDKWLLALLVNGEHITAKQAEIMEAIQHRWNAHDDLLKALNLAAEINPYGSVENAKARHAARAAIARATGEQP
jgi:hypothetical protein